MSATIVDPVSEPLTPLTASLKVPVGADRVELTVNLVVPDVTTDVGEKLAVVPEGSPEMANVTAPVNPPCGETAIE